jgi:hypothetical protein
VPAAAAVLEGFPRERQSCSLLRGGAVREAEGSFLGRLGRGFRGVPCLIGKQKFTIAFWGFGWPW